MGGAEVWKVPKTEALDVPRELLGPRPAAMDPMGTTGESSPSCIA